MTATTVTLASFLLARLDDDEATARAAMLHSGATWSVLTNDGLQVSVVETAEGFCDPYRDNEGLLWDWEGALGAETTAVQHIARHDPARVLAEVEAKRRVVKAHSPYSVIVGPDDWSDGMGRCGSCYDHDEHQPAAFPCPTLRALASVHRTHAEWREEWR